MLILALAACRRPAPEAPSLVEAPDAAAPAPTGRVVDGTYVDGRYPIRVAVPPGWTATPGLGDGPVRLTLHDPEGDVVVRVAGVPGDVPTPRPLAGCVWTFQDLARYRAIRVNEAVLAATCTADEPAGPRVLAWIVAAEGMSWSVEGTILPGRLRAGRADLDTVAAGLRLR